MHRSKHFLILGGILLAASLFFARTPVASTAFAATTGTHSASSVNTLAHSASSRLAPDVCPPSCANPINMCPPSQQDDGGPANDWVRIIQYRLNAFNQLGLLGTYSYTPPLQIDGIFGSDTKAAVVDFQSQIQLSGGGGAVGDRTWSALGFCLGYSTIYRSNSGTTSLTNCPSKQSDGGSNNTVFVQAIQDMLNINFDYDIFVNNDPDNFHPFLASDGSFGTNTKAAVVDYQHGEAITESGAVDQPTWSEMRMCS